MNEDEKFLKETLKSAKRGLSWTSPNPMVGAVIVKNNRIIGKGYHRKYGSLHAEVEALNDCPSPKGATLYINLEPCAHFGKTPPCINSLIQSGIKRVVFCTEDPNPKVKGRSLALLKKAGIQTSVGILEQEAKLLNEAFFTFHEKKRPFVTLKFACSLDGKMATSSGDSKWITNEAARNYARNLRSNHQAVLVGTNTILKDNPHLGIRVEGKKDPVRVILNPQLKIPQTAQVLRDLNIITITDPITIPELLNILKEKNIISLLVEGGGETLGRFIDSKLVDKVYAFHAPIIIGGRNAISISGKGLDSLNEAIHLKNISHKKFKDNFLTTGYVS